MRHLTGNRGFTLVEVMVSLFLLVVGILGTIAVTTTVMGGNSFSKRMTTASTLAQYKMEELKNTAYDDLVPSTSPEPVDSLYTREWTVSEADIPDTGMKTIEVTVSFPWKGVDRTVTLKTIVADL